MSADIEKLAVFDDRIIQSRPKYAVQKGALSLTNAPFNAIAASASQHTYNIYVPSENVYVDRAVEWSSDCYQQFNVTLTGAPPVDQTPLVKAGRDFALCAFPLNSLCSTLTATINDTTSVINSQDVLKEVLRLTDYKKNRLQRTCPTMLDKYASYDDAVGAINNPLAGFESQTDFSETPNGAFYNLIFTTPSGADLATGAAFPAAAFAGANYAQINGIPVYVAALAGAAPAGPFTVYVKWRTTEKLVLSPFTFSDVHEWDTGLFGINNIQLIMNIRSDVSRIIRSTTGYGRVISAVGFNQQSVSGPFSNSVVNVQFLTPSLDVPLPPKSVVPYMEFPRYITTSSGSIDAGATVQIQSQTITLPQIPDLFIIYAKPTSGYSPTQGDWYLPVATSADGVRNPLSVNFDNFSGLLSSVTAEQLYGMSVKNGLEMDWNSWVGEAHSQSPGVDSAALDAGRIQTVGGLLVLKPSQDITLQTGQAPSLVGNFTFQFNITLKNTSSAPLAQGVQLYVITANSGFFESIRGSSRIIKGVLSEQDIISAPLAPMGTRDMLSRMVGGAGILGSLSNVLSKAKDIYQQTKPIVSGVKGMLPEGKVKDVLSMAGYGSSGGAMSGGAESGGAMSGGRKGLRSRLL